MKLRALTLVLLVVLAGCGGSVRENTTTVSSTTTAATTVPATTATTSRRTTTATSSPATTASTPTTVDESVPDNPWRAATVTVSIANHANESRNVRPLVNRTLQYWNRHDGAYGDYNVTFALASPNQSADLVVDFVDAIPVCGPEDNHTTVGCAPVLHAGTLADRPEHVEIVAGYSNESTVEIMKHEFGHVLGIEHGEEPMPTMQTLGEYDYLARPDAVNRTFPWRNATLSVFVSVENRTYRETVREQIRHALDYYERGADGHVPENVTFVMTNNESAADMTIRFPSAVTCGGERDTDASCGYLWGHSVDTDAALEYYTRADIRIGRHLDTDAVGWHTGYWLAYAFGLRDADELPPPFVDPDYETTHGDWWES